VTAIVFLVQLLPYSSLSLTRLLSLSHLSLSILRSLRQGDFWPGHIIALVAAFEVKLLSNFAMARCLGQVAKVIYMVAVRDVRHISCTKDQPLVIKQESWLDPARYVQTLIGFEV